MADERLPLIRGRIFGVDSYSSPPRRGSAARVPSLDPRAHRARVLEQLDAIAREVESRDPTARDELATREIIAVQPTPGEQVTPDQLDDAHHDARLIGVIPETGTVLLDVAHPKLEYLREKIDAFADDARVWRTVEKDGTQTVHRESEHAVAAIGAVRRAALG